MKTLADFGATDLKFKSYPMECDKKKQMFIQRHHGEHRVLSAPLTRFLFRQGQVAGLRAIAKNDVNILGKALKAKTVDTVDTFCQTQFCPVQSSLKPCCFFPQPSLPKIFCSPWGDLPPSLFGSELSRPHAG